MDFTRTGLVLFTEHYEQCVDFYARVLALPVLHSFDNEYAKLTTLDLGGGHYLMIETEGVSVSEGKSIEQSPIWLRFNVEDVEAVAKQISAAGVEVTIRKEAWGTLADFLDPDGHRCTLRDEATFGK